MAQQNKKQNCVWQRKEAWCLIGVSGLLPFIVYLYVYDAGLAEESWFPGETSFMADFFQYYKSRIFLILSACMAAFLGYRRIAGQRENKKENRLGKEWLLVLFLALAFLLSTVCSVDPAVSLWGNYGRFETVFVLFGYLILCMYSYFSAEKTEVVDCIFKVLAVVAALMAILGIFQMAGKDPVFSETFQKMIIPKPDWEKYVGNLENILKQRAVYLTMGNPNTASMYLAMLIILLSALLKNGTKKWKYAVAIIEAGLFVNLVFTFSRVGVCMVLLAALMGLFFRIRERKMEWKKYILSVLCFAGIFLCVDGYSHFRFCGRIYRTAKSFWETPKEYKLTSIVTGKNDIKIVYAGITVYLKYQPGYQLEQGALQVFDEKKRDMTDCFSVGEHRLDLKQWEDVFFFTDEIDDEPFLAVVTGDTVWNFTYVDGVGYMIYTGNGKYDVVKETEFLDMRGHMASGRFYIWSRTIPLLKKYGLSGSGADTFYRVFPQTDYVGKAQYAPSNFSVIEKPHNTYLLTAVQNGIPALVCMLSFFLIYLLRSGRIFMAAGRLPDRGSSGEKPPEDAHSAQRDYAFAIFLTVCAYLAGMMFNDSNLCVSPLFYMMLGFGMRLNRDLRPILH